MFNFGIILGITPEPFESSEGVTKIETDGKTCTSENDVQVINNNCSGSSEQKVSTHFISIKVGIFRVFSLEYYGLVRAIKSVFVYFFEDEKINLECGPDVNFSCMNIEKEDGLVEGNAKVREINGMLDNIYTARSKERDKVGLTVYII